MITPHKLKSYAAKQDFLYKLAIKYLKREKKSGERYMNFQNSIKAGNSESL